MGSVQVDGRNTAVRPSHGQAADANDGRSATHDAGATLFWSAARANGPLILISPRERPRFDRQIDQQAIGGDCSSTAVSGPQQEISLCCVLSRKSMRPSGLAFGALMLPAGGLALGADLSWSCSDGSSCGRPCRRAYANFGKPMNKNTQLRFWRATMLRPTVR